MKFDWKEFRSIEFTDRTEDIELKNFGDGQEIAVFRIRALDAADLAVIRNSVESNRDIESLVQTLISATSDDGTSEEKTDVISQMLGLIREKVPDELVRSYVIFERGVAEPAPESRADIIKFARVYPVEFNKIVARIMFLTGQGGVAKKKQTLSTETPPSDPI